MPHRMHHATLDQAAPKDNQTTFVAWAPLIESTSLGFALERAKKSAAAASTALTVAQSAPCVTSRRKGRQSIALGGSPGLEVGS